MPLGSPGVGRAATKMAMKAAKKIAILENMLKREWVGFGSGE